MDQLGCFSTFKKTLIIAISLSIFKNENEGVQRIPLLSNLSNKSRFFKSFTQEEFNKVFPGMRCILLKTGLQSSGMA